MCIKAALSAFFTGKAKPATTEDPTIVTYEGPDRQTLDAEGDFWFGFTCNGAWLPGVTSDPQIIQTLQGMQKGQLFKILQETADGPMGTRVLKIQQFIVDAEPGPAPKASTNRVSVKM